MPAAHTRVRHPGRHSWSDGDRVAAQMERPRHHLSCDPLASGKRPGDTAARLVPRSSRDALGSRSSRGAPCMSSSAATDQPAVPPDTSWTWSPRLSPTELERVASVALTLLRTGSLWVHRRVETVTIIDDRV